MPLLALSVVRVAEKVLNAAADMAKKRVADQVATWLAYSPEQKRQHIQKHTIAVELTDLGHPAYRRFKELLEPWGLRKKEQGL